MSPGTEPHDSSRQPSRQTGPQIGQAARSAGRRAGTPVGYRWHLRQVMADRGLFATSDLQPLLADRGIDLSASQIYRLVTTAPERLNLATLAALCDALQVTPNDLIEPVTGTASTTGRAGGNRGKSRGAGPISGSDGPVHPVGSPSRPARARIPDSPS